MLARRPLLLFAVLGFSLVLGGSKWELQAAQFGGPSQIHKLWGAYWSTAPDFESSVEVKNNRLDETVTAHISVYFVGGEEYYLRSLDLGPRETKTFSLNEALGSVPTSVASRASHEGTLEIEFSSENPSAIMGSITVLNRKRGTVWNFFLYPASGNQVQPLLGVFWFPSAAADGFVAVQNISEEGILLEPVLHVSGGLQALGSVSLRAGAGYKLELRKELRKLGLQNVEAGGLELRYQGPTGALQAHGVLFDQNGYSTEVDFLRYGEASERRTFSYRTPRFAIGAADPRLGLPPRTKFDSYLVLHNFNGHSQDVELSVGYKQGAESKESREAVSLAAGETRVLALGEEFDDLKSSGVHWASLEASYEDRHSGVSMMLTSLSQTGEHSIRSVMNWVSASVREGWLWRADANQNTLLGIYNADTEDASVMLSLDYYVSGQRFSYEKPLVLPARGSELVDIGQIVAGQQPDADGDVIPSDITYGGYRAVKHSLRGNIPIITEALIYDRGGASFLTVYNTGCCHSAVSFKTRSVSDVVGQTPQLRWEGYDVCLNKWVDITGQASFSLPDPSVAIFTATHGQLLLQGSGTTTSNTQLFYFRETFLGECNGLTAPDSCTIVSRPRVDSVSPPRGLIGANTSVTINGAGFGSGPTVSAGTGITVTVNSATSTQIQATFNVSSTAPSGNHQVTVTSSGKTSQENVNFFVQEPRRLVRLNHPSAPNGIGPLIVVAPGSVVNLAGETLLTNQCGVYRNYAFDLVDQNGDSIDGTYILEEWFDTYSGPVGTPSTKSTSYVSGEIPGDTQYFGKT